MQHTKQIRNEANFMSNKQVWLIDYKQSLQPLSKNNDDASTYLVGTAIVRSNNLVSAIENLKIHLKSEGEDLIDYWRCERYLPKSKSILQIVSEDEPTYTEADADREIRILLSAVINQNRLVATFNCMSSSFLEEEGQ